MSFIVSLASVALLPDEAKKRQQAVGGSQLTGYRCVSTRTRTSLNAALFQLNSSF